MEYNKQQQKMREAFSLYLEKCKDLPKNSEAFYNLDPIDECLSANSFIPISILDFSSSEEFAEPYHQLVENAGYKTLIDEQPLYEEVVKKYAEFLVAYEFANSFEGAGSGEQEEPENLSLNKNIIYFGAPGTGKSFSINTRFPNKNDDNSTVTTFHPDTDYSTFVGCYKPTKDETGELTYDYVPQPFIEAYINAWLLPDYEDYYLVIEEINRGNCAQAFGDIFQLLDRELDGKSSYKITPDRDLQKFLKTAFENGIKEHEKHQEIPQQILEGKKMQLPQNLWLLATMNTSDQSLFPMDAAFKRRWEWKYVPISDGGKDYKIDINGVKYDWADFLDNTNKEIYKLTLSEDKQLGYWFVKVGSSGIINAETFVNKVLFYLWSDVFKDYVNEGVSPFIQKIGKDVNKQTFSSFVRKNGNLDYEAINLFLQHGIKLSPDEEEEQGDSANGSGTETGKKRGARKYLRVTFADGHVLENNNASQVMKDVIEDVGPERVRELEIKRNGCPLIALNLDEVPEPYRDSIKNHRLSNGMYLFTTTQNPQKKEDLERIAREIDGVDYTVEIFTKEDENTH